MESPDSCCDDGIPDFKTAIQGFALSYSLMWRCPELGCSVFDNLCEDKLVSGIVLTRATVETSAALWFLGGKVEEALKSQTVGDIDDVTVGCRKRPRTNPTLSDNSVQNQ